MLPDGASAASAMPAATVNLSPIGERNWLGAVNQAAGVEFSDAIEPGVRVSTTDEGWPVRIAQEAKDSLVVTCDTRGAVPRMASIGREGRFESGDFRLSDDAFDRTFKVAGPERVLVSMLPRTTRGLLLKLSDKGHIDVQGGILTASVGLRARGAEFLGGVVRDVVATARAAAMTAQDTPARLAGIAVDPEEPLGLRECAVVHLVGRWPASEEARSVEATLQQANEPLLVAAAHGARPRDTGAAGGLSLSEGPEEAEGALSPAGGSVGAVSEADPT